MRRKALVLLTTTAVALGLVSSAGAAPNPQASGAALVSNALAQAGAAGQARHQLAHSGIGAVGAQLKQIART